MRDGKFVVMAVDDDIDVLESTRVILEANGYICESAGTGEEALEMVDSISPDFMLVDLMMETMDAGAELAKNLAAKNLNIPLYILSSVGDTLAKTIDLSSLKVSGVIQKPIQESTLMAILKARLKK
jgi:CheY-like chemotaxis protein